MSVLVYAPSHEGTFKKSTLEVVSYGRQLAKMIGADLIALTINSTDNSALSAYGADKVLTINESGLEVFNAQLVAQCMEQAARAENASVVVVDSTNDGLYLAPLLAIKLDAGYASNTVALPSSLEPFTVRRKAFSSKAFVNTSLDTSVKLIGLAKNSFGLHEDQVNLNEQSLSVSLNSDRGHVASKAVEKSTGQVTIADADVVVSGGRGLKGPENWGMVEELAEVLGAATACSKPVSDLGWRPHSEHVGQTGKPVTSNLYIAIGISGAIQHLAGVNSSKVKVVINNDPEAPFFKAAEYGVVGDAFEVVPALIEKLKEFKSSL